MLLSVKKALDKEVITDSELRIKKQTIENYLQILSPAFEFSQDVQSNKVSIGEVVPHLLKIIFYWQKMDVGYDYRRLCNYLVAAFKQKFNYELNSEVYQVTNFFIFADYD